MSTPALLVLVEDVEAVVATLGTAVRKKEWGDAGRRSKELLSLSSRLWQRLSALESALGDL